MSRVRAVLKNASGATAVEFAMVLPPLILVIFLVIEGNRFLWTRQAIQEATSHAARCMAIGNDGCETLDGVKLFAQDRARKVGVPAPLTAITVAANQTCHGVDGMNRVTMDIAFQSPASAFLPFFPKRAEAEACFPSVS